MLKPSPTAIVSLDHLSNVLVPHRQALAFTLKQTWPKDWPSRLRTLGTLTALAGSKYCGSQTPKLMGNITDKLGFKISDKSVSRDSEYARETIMIVARHALLRYLGHALRELQAVLYTKVTNKATQRAAVELFERLQEFDIDFISKSRGGEISNYITTGSSAVGAILNNSVMRFIPMVWEMTYLLKRLEKLGDKRFKGIGKATLAAYSIFTFAYSNRRVAHRLAMTQAEGKVRGRVGESLVNAENVRLMNGKERETGRYKEAISKSTDANVKVNTSLALLNAGQQLILQGGTALASYQMTDSILSGDRRVGDLVELHHTFRHILLPLNFMGTMYREFKTNYKHIRDYLRLFNIQPTVQQKPDAKPLVINRGSIRIDDVSFSYPTASNGSSFSLKNIRMRIQGGSRIAIVGPSGGGKSSLVKLISRLYDVDKGSIAICNQDIRDVTLASLRHALAVVPQETILFNESLLYNVKYGNEDASDEDVWAAIKCAQLDKLIERLPEGVNTLVGERGSRLSGGERQRVAIARCFLKKPAIVLLDEATSNLDANTEKEIQGALRSLQEGRTCVTVAHRLSAIQDVDQIYYLEDGEIKESGNHGELLAIADGKYKQLWENQLKHGVERFPIKSYEPVEDSTAASASCGTQCSH